MAAGLAVALVDVGLAVVARVARWHKQLKVATPVLAGPVEAWVGVTLVDVHLAVGPRRFCRGGATFWVTRLPRTPSKVTQGPLVPTREAWDCLWARPPTCLGVRDAPCSCSPPD